ncbi:uncharacterized protein LOC115964836 [Quercus lobata]|uniref:uncharacterized protein LOC115964836 n=1 Tax=Quercus lobata TaxID=97700 RepID=UPI00124580FD|nr:uncharacterized protein LOC115964836 [Quercus lobata]
MEKLSAMWETFSLSESEGSQYRASESSMEGPYLLVARFFTGRVLSMEAIARTFKLLWHTKKGFEVRDMGNHCVLFAFKEETDIVKILAGYEDEVQGEFASNSPRGRHEEWDLIGGNSAQLDEIDGELSQFDNVKGDLEIAQEGVGSRLLGLALYLKNLFTQEKSTSLNLNRHKFNQVPRKSCQVHAPLEVVLSKRSRQDEDVVLEEANERCKKRTIFSNDLTEVDETWSSKEYMLWVRDRIQCVGCFTVLTDGRGGGEPEANCRREGWNMLRMLSSKPKLSWCCFKDFNELLEVQDKKCGAPRAHNLMENFQDVLDFCGFVDLGYSGPDFTWRGRQRGEMIWERLDKGVANYEWLTKFPTDWTKEWLWRAEDVSARFGNCEVVDRLKKELNVLYDNEEKMWQQRSRIQWLKNGDQNTRFFHGSTTERKRQNFIKGLRDEQRVMQKDEGAVSTLLVEYYTKLFTSSNPQDLDHILDGVQSVVTDEMKVELGKPYTSEKVGEAIRQMAPLKALGSDGMPHLFYQTYWTDVGMDVTQAVFSSLNSGFVLNREKVTGFRPISLCNVIYKTISNVLAIHLKPMLHSIISKTQSVFIANRLISDNFLIAFESLHHMKTNDIGKNGFMAMILDMSKAYDMVEWSFLKQILLKLGF